MGWFEDAHKTMVENLQTFNLQTHLDKYPVGSDIYPVVPILVDRGGGVGWFEDAHKTMVENLQTFRETTGMPS